jgi:hypothetical protein
MIQEVYKGQTGLPYFFTANNIGQQSLNGLLFLKKIYVISAAKLL